MFFTAELVLIGAVTGLLSGMLGAGGGFLFVPLLTLVGVPMRSAAGLSLLYVACVATSGAVSHYRQGTTDVKVAAAAIPGGVMAVPLGSYCSGILSNDLLQVIFGLTVLGGALGLHWQSTHRIPFPGVPVLGAGMHRPPWVVLRRARVEGVEYLFPVSLLRGLVVGAITGFLSGLLGVGGGPIMVALLILLVGVPVQVAMGTSLLAIVLPSVAGVITHFGLGHIDIASAVPAVLAGALGAVFGARGALLLSAHRLEA
ncbi:MAG TPA: sulfite exporter TauE/SafE family protein, partial [Candidatus Methylomirabilis sp.]|nr:sulfite exporter TauE/SafE family protein [Candidatus Methylomirabilis sp.]